MRGHSAIPIVLATTADGIILRVFSVRANGYTFLIVAEKLDLYRLEQLLENEIQKRDIAFARATGTPDDVKLAKLIPVPVEISQLEQVRADSLLILGSALDKLAAVQPSPKRRKKAAKPKPVKKKKRVMSQATKAKISATRQAHKQQSLLRAVEAGQPVAPPPAEQ